MTKLAFGFDALRNGEFVLGPQQAEVAASEVLVLWGPSGSGKSTLLQWLVGASSAEVKNGYIRMAGQDLLALPIEQRQLGWMQQQPLLFPHLSVIQNAAFATGDIVAARQALAEVGLSTFADADPATLSGGQQARVALVRALASKPRTLLLDEPFSSLDPKLRQSVRELVWQQIRVVRIPAILVTHDPADIPQNLPVTQLDLSHA